MRPGVIEINKHVTNVNDVRRVSLDENAIGHLITVLTDLYSNKILAVIREYSTNAYDSHVEAGNPDPILVTLPTHESPRFEVQDFGVGMSYEEINETYSKYGASTKRDSDDVVGMLGLGCKSGLTYCDNFTLIAVKDGEKNTCLISKDEDGVGSIRFMGRSKTVEPNGVTLQFPVAENDINRFVSEASDFYRYWDKGTVLVNGQEHACIYDQLVEVDEDLYARFQGGYNTRSVIVMGNVPYECQQLNIQAPQGVVNFVAKVPIGSVHFTPSRESLHFTSHTEDAIETIKTISRERYIQGIVEKFNSLQYHYEKAEYFNTYGKFLKGELIAEKYDGITYDKGSFGFCTHGRGDSASRRETFQTHDVFGGNRLVIINSPYKGLSDIHKQKIGKFLETYRDDSKNWGWVILPKTVDKLPLILEDYPHLVDWEEIAKVKIERPKVEREVADRQDFLMIRPSIVDEDSALPAYCFKRECDNQRDVYRTSVRMMPGEYEVYSIYKSDEKKFLKLFPGAQHYSDVLDELREAARATVTRDDYIKLVVGEDYYLKSFVRNIQKFLKLSKLAIKDAELVTILNADMDEEFVKRLEIIKSELVHGGEFDKVEEEVKKFIKGRYPVAWHLGNVHLEDFDVRQTSDDIINYINDKFEKEYKA